MMKNSKMILAAALALTATSAFAADATILGGGKGGEKGGRPAQTISWEEFQGRCTNPASFDQQVAPANIVVQCTDVSSEFVPETPGMVQLTATRAISAQVTSDKWVVAGMAPQSIQVPDKSGACLRFKEVQRTFTIEHALSCSDVINMKGTLSDYCRGAIDMSKGKNPKLGATQDTGRVLDTCAGLTGVVVGDDHGKGDDNGKK